MLDAGSSPKPVMAPRWALALLAALVVVGTYLGWKALWFLTDDAFIAFRYVSNSVAGHGYVWNPAPFLPVEGYTSYLWIVLLDLVWRVTGSAPPYVANSIALVFGFGQLYLGYLFLRRMNLPGALASRRFLLLVLLFAFALSNRTFLAWLSSGLETSMFNFLFLGWIYTGLTPESQRGRGWAAGLGSFAAAVALCRPDGLLVVAGSLPLLAREAFRSGNGSVRAQRAAMGGMPLLAVVGHTLWRKATYGEWLPNTYYAKHVSAWPESGIRYLASFVVEYALWIWVIFFVVWLVRFLRTQSPLAETIRSWPIWQPAQSNKLVVLAVVLGHVGYYTFSVGGDHFEYRIYSYLILPLFLSAIWLVARFGTSSPVGIFLLVTFTLFSYPVPWTHWWVTQDLTTREQTRVMIVPIAPYFPTPIAPVIARWDAWQAWLISHDVGRRHQEHKIFYEVQLTRFASREKGELLGLERREIFPISTVGIPGWVYPNVAIIDTNGLCDRVIARNPPEEKAIRMMAHDRKPPPGYLQCFNPTMSRDKNGMHFNTAKSAATNQKIKACEAKSW